MITIKTLTFSLAACSAVIVGSFSMTGCGTGQDRSTATVKASSSVPGESGEARKDLDEVQQRLRNLQDAGDGADLKKLYGELKSHASALKSSLGDVDSSCDAAVAAGKKQITEWHQRADGLTDPDMRNSSNKREGDLRQAVDALSISRGGFKTASDAYSSDLSQTLTALDLDLSKPGVASAKTVMARLVDDEPGLRHALADVSEKSDALNAVVKP